VTDETENLKGADSKTPSAPARRRLQLVILILVLLAPIALFLIVGAVNGRDGGDAGRYEDEAVRIERMLVVSPQHPDLLLELAGARYRAGQEMIKGGSRQGSEEVLQQYRLASQAWSKYLEVASEPDLTGAKAMTSAFITLAEAAPGVAEYREEMRKAAEASEIVERQAPSLDALMAVAYHRDFAFDWKAADKAAADALALAPTRSDFAKIQHALSEYRQIARETKKQMTEG
jgi:hypothetical protein